MTSSGEIADDVVPATPASAARDGVASTAVKRAGQAFEQRFGRAPAVIASAPGRVNLMGDHTDYAGGLVLPIAIEQRTAMALGPGTGGRGSLESLELKARVEYDASEPFEARPVEAGDSWVNLILGPWRELSERTSDGGGFMPTPLHAVIASDVPIGAGVSSSAALSVAATMAALRLRRWTMRRSELVELLRRSEARFAGTPCGIMDMMVALAARRGMAICIDCGSGRVTAVPLPADLAVLLVDSGVRRRLSDGRYAERRREVEAAMDCDASLRSPLLERRARHVRCENDRVRGCVEALLRGDIDALGHMAFESHGSLRDDLEVSAPAIDRIVEIVRDRGRACGALGARMTGGGFGGSVVVFSRRDSVDAVRTMLEGAVRAGDAASVREVRAGASASIDFECPDRRD